MKVKGIGFFALMSFCLFIFSTSVAWSQVSSAITSYSDNVTIKQLLEEVRELRRVMQKNGTVALSTQVLLERVRMQQQRVDALTRDAETVRQKSRILKTIYQEL